GNGVHYGALWEYNTAILYRSLDDGITWEQWQDFQKLFPDEAVTYRPGDDRFKLRHLHDVKYIDGSLLVGTGDVARYTFLSLDNGNNWRKIWDEGFTSGVQLYDKKKILLGPDQLYSHGIALYDFSSDSLKEVFKPADFGYAGFSYSLISYNNVYYVSFHTEPDSDLSATLKYGIFASPDGLNWYNVFDYGPIKPGELTSVYLSAGQDKIYTTVNGTLFAFTPLSKEWFNKHLPLKKVSNKK
ncbi:MAG: hypothetical protein AAB657_00470, partial [Patescibacteria group bacterium]